MLRLAAAVLLAALAACGTSHCQTLGERICSCQPGLDSTTCKTQVQNLLSASSPGEARCADFLATCRPENPKAPQQDPPVDLCDWMLTDQGKVSCGLAAPHDGLTP